MSQSARTLDPIPVTITYLEMTTCPNLPAVHPDLKRKMALMRAEQPPIDFYRFLYDAVGRDWLWIDRKKLTDKQLAAIIHHDNVAIFVLYVGGVPAGFSELDYRKTREANVNLFGLMPEFTGQGLGRYFINWSIEEAWRHDIRRLTINTCTLDHPAALPLYQSAGFVPYARQQTLVDPNV